MSQTQADSAAVDPPAEESRPPVPDSEQYPDDEPADEDDENEDDDEDDDYPDEDGDKVRPMLPFLNDCVFFFRGRFPYWSFVQFLCYVCIL